MSTLRTRMPGWPAALVLLAGFAAIAEPVRAQATYTSISTPQFEFQCDRALTERDIQIVTEFLEKDYGIIREDLGFEPKNEIRVRIHGSVGRFLAETKLGGPWRGAVFSRGILHVQPTQALVQRGIMERSLSYDLSLAYLDQTGNDGCPRWLRESYAVYHSGILPDLTPPVGAKLASFSDLEQDLQRHQRPPQLEDVQFILGQTLQFLFDRFGAQKALALYRQFDGTRSIETIFRKHLGEELSAVEKAWARFIKAKTSRVR